MGVVYKAEDLKLKRQVALKFLRSDVLEDEEHKERFLREAQAAAALDHPNICTVYEIDEADGQTFLSMAYLEGETVKEKIKARPLKLQEALDIAIQTAQGLQAAHEKGVVHRDIKSSNLMVTPQGQVKIMDFGLAQLADRSKLTKTTASLGTPSYMSPEQAQKSKTDRRTDIWSLGVVVYEMVTGRLPFEREREQAVLYSIVNEEPEVMTAQRVDVPVELDHIVGKAMAKTPAERYQHVDELIVDLRRVNRASGSSRSPQSGVSPGSGTLPEQSIAPAKLRIYQLLLVASLMALAALAFLHPREGPTASPLRRFGLTPPVEVASYPYSANSAISPDGRHVAFVEGGAEGRLWVQDLDQERPRPIDETAGALMPFWSPDSKFIGFVAGGELKKVSVRGGIPVRICEMSGSLYGGGSWSPDGRMIVFADRAPGVLFRVSAGGGEPEVLIDLPELGKLLGQPVGYVGRPHFLPSEAGPRTILFQAAWPRGREPGTARPPFGGVQGVLVIYDLRTQTLKVVGRGDFPWYSPSGHIVYQAAFNTPDLWALPIDLQSLEPSGDPFLVAEGGRGPSVDRDGTLAYTTDPSAVQERLIWVNRKGETLEDPGLEHERIMNPVLSPDGRLVGVNLREGTKWGAYVYDTVRKNRTRLGSTYRLSGVLWSASGEQVVYVNFDSGIFKPMLRWIVGDLKEQALGLDGLGWIHDWSEDGERLIYGVSDRDTQRDIWYLQRGKDAADWKRHAFLTGEFDERLPRLSPNGQYVAYVSNESGRDEVYVQSFPAGGNRVLVSVDGGTLPRWSPDGTELFYVRGDTLLAVSVTADRSFEVQSTSELFRHPGLVLLPINTMTYCGVASLVLPRLDWS